MLIGYNCILGTVGAPFYPATFGPNYKYCRLRPHWPMGVEYHGNFLENYIIKPVILEYNKLNYIVSKVIN